MTERSEAYDKIDRFLRNNLDDIDYADYSDALECVFGDSLAQLTPVPQEPSDDKVDALLLRLDDIAREFDSHYYGLPIAEAEGFPLDQLRDAVRAALAQPAGGAPSPVAFVPIHPRQGPLWANTIPADRVDVADKPRYPLMAVFAAQPAGGPVEPSAYLVTFPSEPELGHYLTEERPESMDGVVPLYRDALAAVPQVQAQPTTDILRNLLMHATEGYEQAENVSGSALLAGETAAQKPEQRRRVYDAACKALGSLFCIKHDLTELLAAHPTESAEGDEKAIKALVYALDEEIQTNTKLENETALHRLWSSLSEALEPFK